MKPVHTPLTDLLGIKTPIVSAPMAAVSTGALAAHVSRAGGFGFLSPAPTADPQNFAAELAAARAALSVPSGVRLPVGAGFIGWLLDKPDAGGGKSATAACLDIALAERVRAIWLSFGTDLAPWVRYVRERDPDVLIWVLVNSVEAAQRAAHEFVADVLVVQGIEAGGHGSGTAPPLLTLLPLVARALPKGPPLVAAGGLASGAQVAAVLLLGAAGAVLGTRFAATHEAAWTPAMKATLVSASHTVRTTAYDDVRRYTEWPEGVDGRAVVNKVYEDFLEGLPLEERLRRHDEAMKRGEQSHSVVWAGTSVGLVNELKDAGTIVEEIHRELLKELDRAAAMLK